MSSTLKCAARSTCDRALGDRALALPPRVHRISRQELYILFWSKLITPLAERFGISDTGLAKVCSRSAYPPHPAGIGHRLKPGGHLIDRCFRIQRIRSSTGFGFG